MVSYSISNTLKSQASQLEDWLDAISVQSRFEVLFDTIYGVSFFSKNVEGELMKVNKNFLERFKFQDEEEVIGKKDEELFPPLWAQGFRVDDLEVMETGKPKFHIVELFFNKQGLPDWYITNKMPIFSREGEVMGVMGVTKNHEATRDGLLPYSRISEAIEHIRNNFKEKLLVKDLARMVGLSPRQFGRCFIEAYGITPQQFIMKTRVLAACNELRTRNADLASIAIDLGFYDQSSFTLHFRNHMGITPRRYRERLLKS